MQKFHIIINFSSSYISTFSDVYRCVEDPKGSVKFVTMDVTEVKKGVQLCLFKLEQNPRRKFYSLTELSRY